MSKIDTFVGSFDSLAEAYAEREYKLLDFEELDFESQTFSFEIVLNESNCVPSTALQKKLAKEATNRLCCFS